MSGQVLSINASQRSSNGNGNPARTWALIPVKSLEHSKQRLSSRLGSQRQAFAHAMLLDLLAAVSASQSIIRTAIVTPDPQVADLARKHGILVVDDSGTDMNSAIRQGIAAIKAQGGLYAVILPADIPLITGNELDRLASEYFRQVGQLQVAAIGISPSADKGGTNCLFLPVQQEFGFCYGPNSFELHQQSAMTCKLAVIQLWSATAAMDMDEGDDIDRLISYCELNPPFQRTATWKLLQDLESCKPIALSI
jgi:2-phospho-L-lactate guanylyltransferase